MLFQNYITFAQSLDSIANTRMLELSAEYLLPVNRSIVDCSVLLCRYIMLTQLINLMQQFNAAAAPVLHDLMHVPSLANIINLYKCNYHVQSAALNVGLKHHAVYYAMQYHYCISNLT